MENFDIEKLERKNIYKTPDFFAEMQENVLQKTVYTINSVDKVENINPKKSKNWIYSAAASVAVVLGISMFWMNSKSESHSNVEIAKNETPKLNSSTQIYRNNNLQNSKLNTQTIAVSNTKIEAPKSEKITVPKIAEASSKIINDPADFSNRDFAQNELDKIVDELSANDLAELSNDADADVYLDLYN